MDFIYLYFINLILLIHLSFGKIPDYIKVCRRSEPNVNQCIKNSVDAIRPKLVEGIPELDVPPLEPFKVPKITLERGPKSANINAELSQLQVWGAADFVIIELKSDLENNKFDFKLLLPKLQFQGKYAMDMRVLLLNLHGKGDVNGTLTNYKSDVTMKGRKILKNGVEYLEFDKLSIKLNIGKAQLYFSNLFNGDPVLGPLVNQIINDHSKTFIEEILPALERSIADIFTDTANKLTLKFTYKELFP